MAEQALQRFATVVVAHNRGRLFEAAKPEKLGRLTTIDQRSQAVFVLRPFYALAGRTRGEQRERRNGVSGAARA